MNKPSKSVDHRHSGRYIHNRNQLAERYRERVAQFIEQMAHKPFRQKDEVYDSLVQKIGDKKYP